MDDRVMAVKKRLQGIWPGSFGPEIRTRAGIEWIDLVAQAAVESINEFNKSEIKVGDRVKYIGQGEGGSDGTVMEIKSPVVGGDYSYDAESYVVQWDDQPSGEEKDPYVKAELEKIE